MANAFPVNTQNGAKDALLANRGRVIWQVRQRDTFVDGVNQVNLPTAVERHVLYTRKVHVGSTSVHLYGMSTRNFLECISRNFLEWIRNLMQC